VTKRADLLASLQIKDFDAQYQPASPDKSNRFSFRPSKVTHHYREWPRVADFCAVPPINGLMEKRGGALIDINRDSLERRMRAYFDSKLDWEEYKELGYGLIDQQAGFDPKSARAKALSAEKFNPERIVRYALRPFEIQWCYYTSVNPIWNRARPPLWAQCWEGNHFLMTRPVGVASPEGVPFFFTHLLGDNDFLRGHAYYFPLRLKDSTRLEKQDVATLFDLLAEKPEEDIPVANLSKPARDFLAALGITNPDADAETAGLIWMHALAIGYSPAYLTENADGIRQDWPRIPLPDNRDALLASATLGRQVAALLDTESQVKGVTLGTIRPELRPIAVISRVGGGSLYLEAGELAVTAGWGHAGKGGVTMPGKGKTVARDYTPEELAAVKEGAKVPGLTLEQALAHLGETTYDIYLNEVAYWKNVPVKVWEYTIGGYQVIKKWLSYREQDVFDRSLTTDEAREVMNIARRTAAILLLEPALDANYQTVKQSSYAWP
jgi:hypothetical protein